MELFPMWDDLLQRKPDYDGWLGILFIAIAFFLSTQALDRTVIAQLISVALAVSALRFPHQRTQAFVAFTLNIELLAILVMR
jgi:hypothetical protein